MADQHIFFEQGSVTTGDSGERGSNAEGIASVKPVDDGERASKDTFNRPTENIRLRTEALRTAGEAAKYLLDSNTKWIITAGNADGLSPGPLAMPGVSYWDSAGGTFTTSSALVVQPMNTPDSDKQETKTYSFTDGLTQNATISFTPLSDADPQSSGVVQKRAYNGANLIRIKWEEVPAASLASAVVPNYCDVEIAGDPEHTLIITIRDDDTTQMSNVQTALQSIETAAGQLGDIGLGYVIAGTVATSLLYSVVSGDADYRMKGTFEREVHYIPAATFVDFFATPNTLADGDTLAIQYADLTTPDDSAVQPTGRRESVPSNNTTTFADTTTVAASNLFITSNADDVYKIPLCIPLCKRIGDDLYWIDGTVVRGTQANFPVYFGEHGQTVERFTDLLASDANVTGDWLFEGALSYGSERYAGATGVNLLYSNSATTAAVSDAVRAVYNTYTADHTIAGDAVAFANALVLNAAVSDFSAGIHNLVYGMADPGARLLGILIELLASDTGGATVDEIYGQSFDITFTGTTAETITTAAGAVGAALNLQGGALGTVVGYGVTAPSTAGTASTISTLIGFDANLMPPATTDVTVFKGMELTLTAGNTGLTALYGSTLTISHPVASGGNVFGSYDLIESTADAGTVLGQYRAITSSSTASEVKGYTNVLNVTGAVSGAVAGFTSAIITGTGAVIGDYITGVTSQATVTDDTYGIRGLYSTITNSGAVTSSVRGIYNTVSNTDTAASVYGVHNTITNSATVSIVTGQEVYINNTGAVEDLIGGLTTINSSAAADNMVYGQDVSVTAAATHTAGVTGIRTVTTAGDTNSTVSPYFSALNSVLTLQGSTTATQVTDANSIHAQLNLNGSAVSGWASGVFVDVPSTGSTNGDINKVAGIRISTDPPNTVVTTINEHYGLYIDMVNTGGPDDTAAGIYVETVDVPYGLRVVTADALIPLHVGAGDAGASSTIQRALDVGGGGNPPSDKVALNILGGFKVTRTTILNSAGLTELDAANKTFIQIYGDSSTPTIANITGGVDGQFLVVASSATGTITITQGGNIVTGSGGSITLATNQATLFVFDNTVWREVWRPV